ncbi:MAG: hypothetical protein RLZZ352_1005 [Pseudomonadota bacterium]|jgi:hypothetical protein
MKSASNPIQRCLEELLDELQSARHADDLGRLALLSYCEIRRWARTAGEEALAQQATLLITNSPMASRQAFLDEVDAMIAELHKARERLGKT